MFKNDKRNTAGGFSDFGATEPISRGEFTSGASNNSGFFSSPTKPINRSDENEVFSDTQPIFLDDENKREDVNSKGLPTAIEDAPDNLFDPIDPTTPISYSSDSGFRPVVGWLVCIEGQDRGHDYRLHAGYNNIGRGPSNDVFISGDNTISRSKDARIAFDEEDNVFYFAPFDGTNLVKVNGKVIMMAKELNAYDVLTIGGSKFCFVPFCGDKFSWNDTEDKR